MQCNFNPYIALAQNAFGYDSAKVYSFVNHDSGSCFDFYRDSSFVFVRCDNDACLCIKGTWKEVENKFIIQELSRKFYCGLPSDSGFDAFTEILNNTLVLNEEYKGYGKGFQFQKIEYYSVPNFKRFKIKRYIAGHYLIGGMGPSGPARSYIEKKYNVRVHGWTELPISRKARITLWNEYHKAIYMFREWYDEDNKLKFCHCYE